MTNEFTIAVHCLMVLAKVPGRIYSSEVLSQRVHTHPARVRKIMSLLRRNGLVSTKEGLGGGYKMGRNPCEVTLAMVYRTFACGALKLNWCSKDCEADSATIEIRAALNQVFDRAETLLENYLSQQTIDTLLKQTDALANMPFHSPQMDTRSS